MHFEERGVYKIPPIEALDDYFGHPDPEVLRSNYEDSLRVAEQFESIVEVTAYYRDNQIGPSDVGDAEHVENHWVAANAPLAQMQADRIIRHGYVEAIRVALSHEPPLPIETFWVSGMSDDLELHICEGPRQVTVLQFMPRAGGQAAGGAPAGSRTWVVRVGSPNEEGAEVLDDAGLAIVKQQVSGPAGTTGATAD